MIFNTEFGRSLAIYKMSVTLKSHAYFWKGLGEYMQLMVWNIEIGGRMAKIWPFENVGQNFQILNPWSNFNVLYVVEKALKSTNRLQPELGGVNK